METINPNENNNNNYKDLSPWIQLYNVINMITNICHIAFVLYHYVYIKFHNKMPHNNTKTILELLRFKFLQKYPSIIP